MGIPAFLSPSSMALDPVQPEMAPIGGAAAQAHKLNFIIERQLQDNWCWSAVGVSVRKFYDSGSTLTQCDLANQALGRQDCCTDGGDDPAKCDRPWYLDKALGITGNLDLREDGSLQFSDIRRELGTGAPIGCRIGWYGGGGHFAVVIGWLIGATGTEYVDVADPIWMESQVAYQDFPTSYQTGGDWTHTYFTTAATVATEVAGAMVVSDTNDPDTLGA